MKEFDYANYMRNLIIDKNLKKVRIARLDDSIQNKDDYTRINCEGYGRQREFFTFSHYLRSDKNGIGKPFWRGLKHQLKYTSQVFQLAACDWHCWYCFVDDKHLKAKKESSKFFTCSELLDLCSNSNEIPKIIDLSGGQPMLAPEWILWMVEEITLRGQANKVAIWCDDNLSNTFFWDFLSKKEIEIISEYPKLSIAGCLKGFDHRSFMFNTRQNPSMYDLQFDLIKKWLATRIKFYCYVTFTCQITNLKDTEKNVINFIHRLRDINEELPLKILPLKIYNYSNINRRTGLTKFNLAIENQFKIYDIYRTNINSIYGIDIDYVDVDKI